MFRKPKNRNIRQRQRELSDDEGGGGGDAKVKVEIKEESEQQDDNNESEEEAPIITFSKPKPPPAMLSFNQDEGVDVEEFKIKKPSHKKRAEKLAKRQKELEEKERDQKRAAKIEVEEEIGIVIKNSIKVTPQNVNHDAVEDDPIIIAAIEQDLETRSKFGGFDDIPDAKAVYEAKKRREQMRRDGTKSKLQNGGGDNGYIALSTGTTKTIEKVAHSRLIREDENDMSDEDGENAQEFYSSKSLLISEEERRRKEQEEFLRLEGDSDDDEDGDETAAADEEAKRRAQESDDEFAEWEKHQIRKAVSTQKVKQMRQENYAINNEPPPEVINLEDGEEDMDIEIIDAPVGLKGGNVPSCSQTSLTDIMEKLRKRVQDKQEFIDSQKAELQRKEANVEENVTLIAGIEADYPILREKYRTYQEMRLFIKDLLDCINEKIDTINDVENRIFSMWKSRSEKIMKRRRADIQDQYQRCYAAALGRTYQPSSDVMQRETNCNGRRASRRNQREKAGIQDRHHDGLSSDEEEPESQKFEYQRTIADGLELAADVFHDASEDYTDIGNIMSRFVDWILVDQKSFDDAYVSLCLPKLLSPFIRLELLDWDPLKDVSKPLHYYSWYQALLQVGTNKVGFDLENATIVGLIPAIIEKLFIPRLTKIINEQWDPFSLAQTRNLTYFISLLIEETPTLTAETKSIKNLLKAIMSKFKSAINEDTFVPLYAKEALQNTSTGCYAFLSRRFWSLIKLIQSANCFRQILSKEALHELIIDGIINRGCVLALQLSPKDSPKTIQKCNAIIDEIPTDWLPPMNSAPFCSLLSALKLISEANDSRQTSKIDKFIETVEPL
uniref:GCF C-terminal domain-containing protein n=1 Tax=Panagrolaimus superbus TaxID=310955 RepID=A0A914YYG9_9BILA